MGIGNHVGGGRDRHEPHHGDKPERVLVNVPERQPHGDEDERELADLRDGQARQKPSALAVAHPSHDGNDDKRVADQDEQGEHDGAGNMGAEQRQVEGGTEGDEEEQQQEIAQRREPRGDGLPVRGRCQRHPRQQTTHFLAEPDEIADGGEYRRLGNGEDHKKFGRPRQSLGERIGGVTDEQHNQPDQNDTRAENDEDIAGAVPLPGADADGGQHDHGEDNHKVLHDQEAERDLAMQRVDLALIRQQLHDDDGAREGERDRDV